VKRPGCPVGSSRARAALQNFRVRCPNDRWGSDNVGCKSSVLSPHRADRLWLDFHIRYSSIEHCLALRLDLGTRTLALSDDDHRYLCDIGRVLADRITRPRCPQKHYLVHCLVERGARSDHGRPVVQRAGGAWSSIGRCARALPHSDHTRRIDAEDCASPSVGERCRPARNCNRPPRRDSWPATRSPCAFFFALRSDGQMIVSGRRAFAVPNTSSNVCRSARSTSAMVTEWPRSTRLVTP
jgi:hypothetical protein